MEYLLGHFPKHPETVDQPGEEKPPLDLRFKKSIGPLLIKMLTEDCGIDSLFWLPTVTNPDYIDIQGRKYASKCEAEDFAISQAEYALKLNLRNWLAVVYLAGDTRQMSDEDSEQLL